MSSGETNLEIEVLVGDDALDSIGADEELLSIVLDELRPLTSDPHAELLHRLIGTPNELESETARTLWRDGLEHRRALSEALGRAVHLRTALFDLLSSRGLKPGMTVAELLAAKPEADELTGALRAEVFQALVEHQSHQRTREASVIACITVVAETTDGFDPLEEQSVLASLAHSARKRFRRSDALGVLNAQTLTLLLMHCAPEKAATLLRQLESDVREAHPGRSLRLASGVTALNPGEGGATTIDRARSRMEQWTQSQSGATLQALWPLAIFATTSASRFHEVHHFFAERGWALLLAKDRATADQAARRLSPAVVLADVMLPPTGGLELLEGITRAAAPTAGFLVAPARWSSISRGRGLTFPTLHLPFGPGIIQTHLERHLGPVRAPVGPLASERDAEALGTALQTLLTGWKLPPHLQDAVGARPELQVAQARMAGRT